MKNLRAYLKLEWEIDLIPYYNNDEMLFILSNVKQKIFKWLFIKLIIQWKEKNDVKIEKNNRYKFFKGFKPNLHFIKFFTYILIFSLKIFKEKK